MGLQHYSFIFVFPKTNQIIMTLRFFFVLLSIVFVLFSISAKAQSVNQTQAEDAAIKFLQVKYPQKSISKANFQLQNASDIIDAQNPQLYMFNIGTEGFVIIAGDKSSIPVIAYSDHSSIPDIEFNPNFENWIQNYVNQIDYFRNNNIIGTTKSKAEWAFLLNDTGNNPFVSTKAVDPFLRSTWGQSGNYQLLCPTDAQGYALVGCVATAMAQVIYYYRFPATGNGSHTYYAPGYGNQSVNFGASTYDYNLMADEANVPMFEIAELSYHCAVSVDMYFGYDGSGANTYDVDDALEDYFRYDTDANYQSKFGVSNTTWKTWLRSDLDNFHPVIYSGSGSGGGHAFVADGYDGTDYFHFDWGWDGYANGYFYLDALNPAGSDFNDWQGAVFEVYPPSTSYPYGCSGNTTLEFTHGSIEDGSGPMADYASNSSCSWLISPDAQCDYYSINFQEMNIATDDQLVIYEGPNNGSTVAGTYTGSTLPSTLTVNSSEVFLEFTSNSSNNSDGFLLNYAGHVPTSCQGIQVLTAQTDTFDDGSGTNHYGNNSFCRWNITPAGATSITIHFLEFDVEETLDYVRIIDGSGGATIAEYSGSSLPSSTTVNSDKMTVMFKTNASYTGQGFKAFYTATTGINDNPEGISMRIFPNPATDILKIAPGNNVEEGVIVIYDYSGREIYNYSFSNEDLIIIPVAEFSAGIYQVGLLSEKGNVWQKFMIE
ncbi:MAG: hypothetical protein C0592_04305 [Marinilabiliales bacterium]|nr:MAG: hypothetical protein C0592_04305 [Marinilabiliales bacterium]